METLLLLAAVAGGRATARSLCVQAVGCGLIGLAAQFSDESALEVCIHVMHYTNRRLYFYFFYFYFFSSIVSSIGDFLLVLAGCIFCHPTNSVISLTK